MMIKENIGRYVLRVSGRVDAGKVACLQPLQLDLLEFDGEQPIGLISDVAPHIVDNMKRTLAATAKEPVPITSVALAEEMEISRPLTKEEFDEEWAAAGYSVGDLISEFITLDSWKLDAEQFVKSDGKEFVHIQCTHIDPNHLPTTRPTPSHFPQNRPLSDKLRHHPTPEKD